MNSFPQGKVTPGATPGTPVQLPAPDSSFALVAAIHIAQIAGSTGNVYFGLSGLKRSGDSPAFQSVIRQFQAPAASGFLDSEMYGDPTGDNLIDPTQFFVDADNANQGMLVTYFRR